MSIVIGLAIFNKKLYPEEGKDEKMGISGGIPAVLRNKKLSEFRSEPFPRRENDLNSRPLNRNRSKLFSFCSKAFRKRKTGSESPKIEENFQNFVSKTFRGRKKDLNFVYSAEFVHNVIPVPTLIVTVSASNLWGLVFLSISFCLFVFGYRIAL